LFAFLRDTCIPKVKYGVDRFAFDVPAIPRLQSRMHRRKQHYKSQVPKQSF
jgi:hypothetical protein